MSKIEVKQIRSQIKCPQNQKRTLEALGLKRIGHAVIHESSSSILGMVNVVKHLVSVSEVK